MTSFSSMLNLCLTQDTSLSKLSEPIAITYKLIIYFGRWHPNRDSVIFGGMQQGSTYLCELSSEHLPQVNLWTRPVRSWSLKSNEVATIGGFVLRPSPASSDPISMGASLSNVWEHFPGRKPRKIYKHPKMNHGRTFRCQLRHLEAPKQAQSPRTSALVRLHHH